MKSTYQVILALAIVLLLLGIWGPTALVWLNHYYQSHSSDGRIDPWGPFWAPFAFLMEFRAWIFVTSACFGVVGLALRFKYSNSGERNKQLSKT